VTPFAIAFPVRETDRAILRREFPGVPLPALYTDGIERPCRSCAMPLNVGPRIASLGCAVYCPWCILRVPGVTDATVIDLGNPASTPERAK
jgi:hypothetical protein